MRYNVIYTEILLIERRCSEALCSCRRGPHLLVGPGPGNQSSCGKFGEVDRGRAQAHHRAISFWNIISLSSEMVSFSHRRHRRRCSAELLDNVLRQRNANRSPRPPITGVSSGDAAHGRKRRTE